MIDPSNPPHIASATDEQLEEFLLFSATVAGHHASSTAASLASWLAECEKIVNGEDDRPEWAKNLSPLGHVRNYLQKYTIYTESGWPLEHMAKDMLASDLKRHGIGCYNQRAETYVQLAKSLNHRGIRDVHYQQLLNIKGIAHKTASFFLAYSGIQPSRVVLDVHILRWLSKQGWDVPKQTPRSDTRYEEVAALFRMEAEKRGMTTLELDRAVWHAATEGNGNGKR